MAGRVTVGIENSYARSDFSAALDELPVLPFWKILCDAASSGLTAFGKLVDATVLGPELIFDAVDDEFGVRERRRVRPFLHQAPDVVRVEMRDQNRADVGEVDRKS